MIQRIIASPFVFGFVFVYSTWKLAMTPFILTYRFILNGGELITYTKDSKKTIGEVYSLLKNKIQDGAI